jgi:hypothetical protein
MTITPPIIRQGKLVVNGCTMANVTDTTGHILAVTRDLKISL